MQVRVLTAGQVRTEVARLLLEHQEIHWALAWGSDEKIYRPLLEQRAKFVHVVFGIAFCQTDPSLITNLVDVKGAMVVRRYEGGTFHPKIYAFRSGAHAAAIVGSANFTPGGHEKNFEAAVLLEGAAADQVFLDIFGTVERASAMGKPVQQKFAQDYELQCKRMASIKRVPRDPALGLDKDFQATGSFIDRSWTQHLSRIKEIDSDRIAGRLAILKEARRMFASRTSFARLKPAHRKAIAGVIGQTEQDDAGLSGEWGWFGGMRASGAFTNRIGENDRHLAGAIDSIPLQGAVSVQDYNRFAERFELAFVDSERMGRISTASRLLALKRPDMFLCISGANERRASKDFGYARTTLSIANYWQRIVEPIQASDWYNSRRPKGRLDGQVWDGRAAMLDSYLYDPGFHQLG